MSILHGRQEGKTSAAFANQHFPVILSLCYISNLFFSSKSSNYESGAWYRVQHSRLQELFSCKSRKFRISPSARTRSGGSFFKETEQDERRHRKIVGAEKQELSFFKCIEKGLLIRNSSAYFPLKRQILSLYRKKRTYSSSFRLRLS